MKLIKKFIPYYKPYLGVFFLDLLCASILSIIDLAFPQFLRILRATLFLEAPEVILKRLGLIAVLLIAMYAVRSLCRWYVTYQGHMMGARMESGMRRELFDKFESFSFSYYDTHNTGEMMSKLVSDLFDISEIVFVSWILHPSDANKCAHDFVSRNCSSVYGSFCYLSEQENAHYL